MSPDDRRRLASQLRRHEAERLKPYMDCCGKPWRDCRCVPRGKLTIGIGRNLDDEGITPAESAYLQGGDIDRVTRGLVARYPTWFPDLDPVRQAVLVNMGFNLGLDGLAGFPRFIAAVANRQYAKAADEMVDSDWAKEVGRRAVELAAQMKTGQWGPL